MTRLQAWLLLLVAPMAMAHAEQPTPGWASLTAIDALPLLREGVRVYQVSSYDRTGDNNDRNTRLYQTANGESVLFDGVGPGCVYRMWLTYSDETFTTNRLRVYIDGETAPRLDMNIADLFTGNTTPFLTPFVGNKEASSGGLYCYVPIPYREHCRITMTGFPPESERHQHWPADWGYYHVSFHRLEDTNTVTSWTGTEPMDEPMRQWAHIGRDPKATNDDTIVTGSLVIPPGASGTLVDLAGPGRITGIRIDPSPHDQTALRAARIVATWDDLSSPDIDAPLGDFFGSGFGETSVASLMLGMQTDGAYWCYFPMPFWFLIVIPRGPFTRRLQ